MCLRSPAEKSQDISIYLTMESLFMEYILRVHQINVPRLMLWKSPIYSNLLTFQVKKWNNRRAFGLTELSHIFSFFYLMHEPPILSIKHIYCLCPSQNQKLDFQTSSPVMCSTGETVKIEALKQYVNRCPQLTSSLQETTKEQGLLL